MRDEPRVGLQISIVLVIGIVVTCLTIATASIIFVTSTQAAREGADRLFDVITARVTDQVDGEIRALLSLAQLGAALPAIAEPVLGDPLDQPATPMLRHLLDHNANLYSVYVAYPDGAFLQAIATRDDSRILNANQAPKGTATILRSIVVSADQTRHEIWTFLDHGGAVLGGGFRRDGPSYDPRQRGWYIAALAVPQHPHLSPPYLFASLPEPGLSASAAAGNGIVFGLDVSLRGLAGFIAGQTVSPDGGVVLLDHDRQVLALSPSLIPAAGFHPLDRLDNLSHPLLRALVRANPGQGVRRIEAEGNVTLVQLTEWHPHAGRTVAIGIVSPFADFTGAIRQMQGQILQVSLFTLALVVPVSMFLARYIARAIRALMAEARRVEQFDFSGPPPMGSFIREFYDLAKAFGVMKTTIALRTNALAQAQARLERLVDLGIALSAERDSARLLELTVLGAIALSRADGCLLYLRDGDALRVRIHRNDRRGGALDGRPLPADEPVALDDGADHRHVAAQAVLGARTISIADIGQDRRFDFSDLIALDRRTDYRSVSLLAVPLKPHGGDVTGALVLVNARDADQDTILPFSDEIERFIAVLAAQAATALDNRNLLAAQERLMDAMIRILAGAIDAKSPYTGGHCARVPELAVMLAEEASRTQQGPLAAFHFDTPDQWREFRIGAWLHDCGKVTTPEFVVDKATKLETIHNRIHEVRTRFEVLWRDAHIAMLEAIAAGTPRTAAEAACADEQARLSADFTFVAACNIGAESMPDTAVIRLADIGRRTWMRHFDDRIGLSRAELNRIASIPPVRLPAPEPLLADKPHHVIPRPPGGGQFDPALAVKVETPPHLYHFGEIHNLSIRRGTLTPEERYKINEHIIQTIVMLETLPFPRHLARVPEYAGTHHETLTGTGYPRRLGAAELSIPARIMSIADIFEALTAADRPYKPAKSLSEAIDILATFKHDGLIDPDLFNLFLSSGVYLRYGQRFLSPDQLDTVDVRRYLDATEDPAAR